MSVAYLRHLAKKTPRSRRVNTPLKTWTGNTGLESPSEEWRDGVRVGGTAAIVAGFFVKAGVRHGGVLVAAGRAALFDGTHRDKANCAMCLGKTVKKLPIEHAALSREVLPLLFTSLRANIHELTPGDLQQCIISAGKTYQTKHTSYFTTELLSRPDDTGRNVDIILSVFEPPVHREVLQQCAERSRGMNSEFFNLARLGYTDPNTMTRLAWTSLRHGETRQFKWYIKFFQAVERSGVFRGGKKSEVVKFALKKLFATTKLNGETAGEVALAVANTKDEWVARVVAEMLRKFAGDPTQNLLAMSKQRKTDFSLWKAALSNHTAITPWSRVQLIQAAGRVHEVDETYWRPLLSPLQHLPNIPTEWGPREIATVAASIGSSPHCRTPLAAKVLNQLLRHTRSPPTLHHVSTILFCCATLGVQPPHDFIVYITPYVRNGAVEGKTPNDMKHLENIKRSLKKLRVENVLQ